MNGLFENGGLMPVILLLLLFGGNGFGGCGPEPAFCPPRGCGCGIGMGGILPIILLLSLLGGGFGNGCCCGKC